MKRRFLFFFILFVFSCSVPKKEENQELVIPVYFSSFSQAPLIQMDISEKNFVLKLDLGSTYQIMLRRKALDQISEKEFTEKSVGIDIQGNRYEQPMFKISNIKLGSLFFQDGCAAEENEFFLAKGSKPFGVDKSLNKELQLIDGRIGCGFFHSSVCFFNLSRSLFLVGPDLETLAKGYDFTEMVQAPFDFEKGLVCVQFQTEQGLKKFILDTGASQTVVKKTSFKNNSKHVQIKNLQLGSLQIGKWEGLPLDFPEKLQDIDGILGIDFFKEFVICIDFPNRKIYLKPK